MKTLIDQVKEADEKMTKAPWDASIDEHESAVIGTSPRCSPVVVCTMANFADVDGHYRYNQPIEDDCNGIALYRNAAPILARHCELLERNPEKAMDTLRLISTLKDGAEILLEGGCAKRATSTLAEIQKEIECQEKE